LAVIVAHRPSMLAVANLVLLMEAGRLRAFGKKEEVLPRILAVRPAQAHSDTASGAMVGYDR
jgi:ABC-type protease/lipase transport system fused ATPase/permease subunit